MISSTIGFNFAPVIEIISKLKRLNKAAIEKLTTKTVERTIIENMALQAQKPFCAEQVINILAAMLTLKTKRVYDLGEVKLDNIDLAHIFAASILPLLAREKDDFLTARLKDLLHTFLVSTSPQMEERDFLIELQRIREQHISSIDMDAVMQSAEQASSSTETLGKDAILIVGFTGAGKSFLINYLMCPEIFTMTGLFSKSLTIKPQPDFVKHIVISDKTNSETSKMGVVDIKNSKAPGIAKYHKSNVVVCDTPGAKDNRIDLPEIKLNNVLETVIPTYKANNVRLVITLAANATDNRGDNLRETIKFIAKMFSNADTIKNAAPAITFVVNGKDSDKEGLLDLFKKQISDFINSKDSNFTEEERDNCVALLKIMEDKFKNNKVSRVCPGKTASVSSEKLMADIMATTPTKPDVLCTFADPSIQDKLQNETIALTRSIDRILESLQKDITPEVVKIQFTRLAQKLKKLSFMDSYFKINQTDILPYFDKVVDLVGKYQQTILSTLCPEKGSIDPKNIDTAINSLDRLRELDKTINNMIFTIFAENRTHVVALLKAFNKKIELSSDFPTWENAKWETWVLANKPESAALKVEQEMISFRKRMSLKLEGLRRITESQTSETQVSYLTSLANKKAYPIANAELTQPDNTKDFCAEYAEQLDRMQTHLRKLNETDVKSAIALYSPDNSDIDVTLLEVVSNIIVQDTRLARVIKANDASKPAVKVPVMIAPVISASSSSTLSPATVPAFEQESDDDENYVVDAAKTDSSKDVLGNQFDKLTKKLINFVEKSIQNGSFVPAILAIEKMEKYNTKKVFPCFAPIDVESLKTKLEHELKVAVTHIIEQLTLNKDLLDPNRTQRLLFNLNLIDPVRKMPEFEKYTNSLYTSELSLELTKLDQALVDHFSEAEQKIINVMNTFDKDSMQKLDDAFQHLWYVLSLPCGKQAELAKNYSQIAQNVGKYCVQVSARLSGQLQIEGNCPQEVYDNIRNQLSELTRKFVSVLAINEAKVSLVDGLKKRAEKLIEKLNTTDLSVEGDQVITNNITSAREIAYLGSLFADDVGNDVKNRIENAKSNFDGRIAATLDNIEREISNVSTTNVTALPVDRLVTIDSYLNQCVGAKIYEVEVSRIRQQMKVYAIKHAQSKDEGIKNNLNQIATDGKSEEIIKTINEYKKLKNSLSWLYTDCGSPLTVWAQDLQTLAAVYDNELSLNLQKAIDNQPTDTEGLLQQVEKLSKFDSIIREYSPNYSEDMTVVFKSLHKRYKDAFNKEHFAKLKAVISHVLAGNFIDARTAANSREFAPGTDMRKMLVTQIETCMVVSISSLHTNIQTLTKKPTTNPNCMKDIMLSVTRLKNAESLIEADLLPKEIVNNREALLNQTQVALDAWFNAVCVSIKNDIERLDFKLVIAKLAELDTTLNGMNLKPSNHALVVDKVKASFTAKTKECMHCYQQPIENYKNNKYTLAQIARALNEVESIEFVKEKTYGECWKEISTQVFTAITNECSRVEQEFSKNKLSVKQAAETVQEILNVTKNLAKDEPTYLSARVQERCSETVTHIENDIIISKTERNEDARNEKISALLTAIDNFKVNLGTYDAATAAKHLSEQANRLNTDIIQKFSAGSIPESELICFAKLYQNFENRYAFFKTHHKQYADQLNNQVTTALANINAAIISYGNDIDQEQSLKTIHASLTTLITIQRLATTTKSMAQLVDATLPNQVCTLLQQVKNLLSTNNSKFKTALGDRNIVNLDHTLKIASGFQEITSDINKYIAACAFKHLPPDLQQLNQLNTEFSFAGFRKQLMDVIINIHSSLSALDPTKKSGGEESRREFYSELKRNIQFLEQMPKLQHHFDATTLQHAGLTNDFGLENCIEEIAKFLTRSFQITRDQLYQVDMPNDKHEWEEFNRLYRDILIFVEQSYGVESLTNIKLSSNALLGTAAKVDAASTNIASRIFSALSSVKAASSATEELIPANILGQMLSRMFQVYFQNILKPFKEEFARNNNDDMDRKLVSLLCGLQKMAMSMPSCKDELISKIGGFIEEILKSRDRSYVQFLVSKLRQEKGSYPVNLINTQSVFDSIITEERNNLTSAHNIDYVLSNLEVSDKNKNIIRKLHSTERDTLEAQWEKFEPLYNSLVHDTIVQKDFATHATGYIDNIRAKLKTLMEANKPERGADGKIIWNEKITNLLPEYYAHLYAIWTLELSKKYAAANAGNPININSLKRPHPAQVVAGFLMLNTLDANNSGLEGAFEEVLTGQGKSVVLAATSALTTLLGFGSEAGCYSEYLSQRDASSFKWFFDLLKTSKFMSSGTFNGLTEDMLNRKGDIRNLLSNKLLGTKLPVDEKEYHDLAETLAYVDEVDSLVTSFFGFLYQPFFLLQDPLVKKLLDAIWVKHENGAMKRFNELLALPEYTALLAAFPKLDYIIKNAAIEMFNDLQSYKKEDGHDFHVNAAGYIYYKHFDGTTMDKSMGYRTYWAARSTNKVVADCRESHEGIKITCGTYSYAHLMKDAARYRAMLGVTGTLKDLGETEKAVVREVFGIKSASFIPSSYGKNKVKFEPGIHVHVVEDDDYNLKLTEKINRNRLDHKTLTNPIRPVLVFFDNEEELTKFYKSDEFKAHRESDAIKLMTSENITTPAERELAINDATFAGAITLAVKEHGRGSDYMLTDPVVINNGGMAVLDGNLPDTAAEQRQHMGRAGRQSQDGTFEMVIKKSELLKKFGLTSDQIETARLSGKLWELISTTRDKKMDDEFKVKVSQMDEIFSELHQPAMNFLRVLQDPKSTMDDVVAAHKLTMPNSSVKVELADQKKVRMLLMFDSTGSMGHLIAALKEVLSLVIKALVDVMKAENIDFAMQIATYKDYGDENSALTCTEDWSEDPVVLNEWIAKVSDSGGGNSYGGGITECVETALALANKLADEGLTVGALFGDEPPSSSETINIKKDRISGSSSASSTDSPSVVRAKAAVAEADHYKVEAEKLKAKKIPISTFFLPYFGSTPLPETTRDFKDIADTTGGTSDTLDLKDKDAGKKKLIDLLGKTAIDAAVSDGSSTVDTAKSKALFDKFKDRMQSFRR